MDNYKYRLEYINNDTKVTHEFPADLCISELAAHLRDFLCGCSWSEDTLEEVLNWEY